MNSNDFSSTPYSSAWNHIQEILVGRNRSLEEVKKCIDETRATLEEENHLLDISDRILDILIDALLATMEADLADQLGKMQKRGVSAEGLPPDYLFKRCSGNQEYSPTLEGSLEILFNSLNEDSDRTIRVACVALGVTEPEREEKLSYLDIAQDLLALLKLEGLSSDRLAESIRRKPEFSSVK